MSLEAPSLNVRALLSSPFAIRRKLAPPKIVVEYSSGEEQEGEFLRRSNGDITSPGLSPNFVSHGMSEVTMRHKGSRGKRHSGGFERPNSVASLSGCYKNSKYNSMTSLNSEAIDTQYINQEEIMQLTKDVRKFSESLTYLRDVFTDKQVRGDATIQVAAHERLRNLLSTLRVILDQYSALKSSEIHTAALHLIKQVKGMPANEEFKSRDAFLEALDQLAFAFSNSVTEYLMGDVEQRLTGAKSFESLTSVGSTVDPYVYGNHHVTTPDKHQSIVGDIGNMEDVDNLLMRLDTGVEISLERNKAWSKYAKDIITYVQKRLQLELDFSRSLAKLASATQGTLKEESFLPFHSAYLTTLEHDVEYSRNCEAAFTQLQGQKFVEQLESRRLEHDSKRKSIRQTWSNMKKEMHECQVNLEKARQLYYTRYQDYERVRAMVAKSESDAMNTSGGSHSAKLEKKKKLEEDNLVKAQEAETTYKACIHEANTKQQELLKVKKEVLTQLKELVFQCDQTMKAVTYGYFQIHKSVSAPTPIQFQALCEQAKEYVPGVQFREYLKHSMPVLSSHLNQDAEVFTFEPYISESADNRDRKQSTQSFDSVDEELRAMKRGNRISNSHEKAKRTSAWVSGGVSDSESISGSSTKSVDASPSGSPRDTRRGIKREQSGGTLSSGDEILPDGDEPSPVVVESGKLIDSMPNAFRNLTISKAAQTHVLRKLRTPSKCRECDSYVYFNGAECEKCGLASHKKCLEYLAIQCGGKRLQGKMNVFGVPLETHLRATGRSCPFIVTKCITEIESRAMNIKGIYRVAGLKGKVEKLCQTFENGAELVDLSETQPHLVTSALKLYFRQLPESLLQFTLFQEFVSAAKEFPASKDKEYDRDVVIARFQKVTNKLPLANQKTASVLMHHLKRVSEHENTNQMTTSNLSIVFAPTLLRPSDDLASLSALMDINHQTRATELMIKYPEIFGPQVPQTPVEPIRQDSSDVKEKAVSPNKSANNSSHLAATSSSKGLSHTPPGRVSGFVLPGSSEESDDLPQRQPPANLPSVEMESDGRDSSVDGESDGDVTDDDDSEANDRQLGSSHAKSRQIPILGSRMNQAFASSPDVPDQTGSPSLDPKGQLSPMQSFEGYIPSAFSEVQPTRSRQGILKDLPAAATGGASGPKRKTSKGQKKKSPNMQRRDREPKFV